MFEVTSDAVFVQDLGSRNGTDVNGKKLDRHDPYRLKNGDLVKIGPLTFAVSIEGAVDAAASPPPPGRQEGQPARSTTSSHDEIDAWLVSDASKEPPERPSGVYGGDTITIDVVQGQGQARIQGRDARGQGPGARPRPAEPVPKTEIEPITARRSSRKTTGSRTSPRRPRSRPTPRCPRSSSTSRTRSTSRRRPRTAAAAAKGPQKDSSDAASDILRKMMDRRKASKS